MNVILSKNAELQDIFIINTSKGDLHFLDIDFKVIFLIESVTKTSFRVPINLINHSKTSNEGDLLLMPDGDRIIISVWNKQQI